MKRFRLSEGHSSGVSCDERGLSVGGTPLLERIKLGDASPEWRPRSVADLNRDLSRAYGFEVDAVAKIAAFNAAARALERGDVAHARITALFLRIPDPPSLSKLSGQQSQQQMSELAADLHTCGLLKFEWGPAKHPRWPAGMPDGVGGQFSPAGAGEGSLGDEPSARAAQGTTTFPHSGEIPEAALPRPFPFPSEVVPPPILHRRSARMVKIATAGSGTEALTSVPRRRAAFRASFANRRPEPLLRRRWRGGWGRSGWRRLRSASRRARSPPSPGSV